MKKILLYAPTWITALVILYLSLIRVPNNYIPTFNGFDKLAHSACYLVLALCFVLNLQKDNKYNKMWLFIVGLSVSLYGGIIELLQEYFFPPRTGDWIDLAADIIGCIAGIIIAIIITNICKQKKN
jgi:VanZ family protein